MRRRQLVGLTMVGALVGGALLLRTHAAPAAADGLGPLRRAAALAPCPVGLGPTLPAVTLPCLSGGPDVTLRGRPAGRPMLVNIWASWCAPCVREVPALLAFSAKAGDRVGVVGVLHEDQPGQALEFARQYGMHYPSLVDDQGVVLRRYAAGPPATLFLDSAGAVRFVQRGQFHSVAQIEQLVAEHLGVRL